MRTRDIIIFLIIFTCIADIATFFYGGLYEFEINPAIVMLKDKIGFGWAIAITILYKVLVNAGLCYMLYKYNPKKTHFFAYTMVYAAIMIIGIQAFGTYSNLNVHNAYSNDPVNVKPIGDSNAIDLAMVASNVYYAVTLLNFIAFFVYEKIFRVQKEPVV